MRPPFDLIGEAVAGAGTQAARTAQRGVFALALTELFDHYPWRGASALVATAAAASVAIVKRPSTRVS